MVLRGIVRCGCWLSCEGSPEDAKRPQENTEGREEQQKKAEAKEERRCNADPWPLTVQKIEVVMQYGVVGLPPVFQHFGVSRGGDHPIIDQTAAELAEYFGGKRFDFEVPLAIRGTPFQESVWRELLRIPYGETRAYADIADTLAIRNGQRAVGLANGQNRIAIIIPCHRVIERAGGLRGYGGGLARKKFLLDLEARSAPGGPLSGTPLALMASNLPDAPARSPQP